MRIANKPIIEKRPKCQTENCNNIAIGVLGGKFRCGECIIRYEKKLKEEKEKMFIRE